MSEKNAIVFKGISFLCTSMDELLAEFYNAIDAIVMKQSRLTADVSLSVAAICCPRKARREIVIGSFGATN
jgi:hypothetical protein